MTSAGGLSQLQTAFRETMAAVCTPVAVITALRGGLPHGTTVSAFASLSMTPPMVFVALDRRSRLLTTVVEVGHFGVNVLGVTQSDLAANFAVTGGTEKFTGIDWHVETDVPRLPGAAGFLACRIAQVVDGRDHLVILGDVLAAKNADRAPLTYYRRDFGTHSALMEQR